MPTFVSGSIQTTSLNQVLSGNVSIPASSQVVRDSVNDPTLQTINIGYGILSENPEDVKNSIQDDTATSYQVFLTKAMDCSLIGVLDSNDNITRWDTSDSTFSVSSNIVSNNNDLYNSNLNVLRASIEKWLNETCFSSSYASHLVSFQMEKYNIQIMNPLLDDSSDPLNYVTRTTRALTGILKSNIENNGTPVIVKSDFECVTTMNVPYNVFNKRSTYETMVSVNAIIDSPTRISLDDTSLENPTNAIVTDSGLFFNRPYVRCKYSVFVDCFKSASSAPPPLLELVFNTDFYFNTTENAVRNPGETVTFLNPSQFSH